MAWRLLSLTIVGFVCFASLAQAEPPPLAVYGHLPQTEELDLSPNGARFARISTEGERRLLIVENVAGGVELSVPVGNGKVEDLEWANDDMLVVYLHLTDNFGLGTPDQEFLQGILIDMQTKKATPLLPDSKAYLPAIFGRYGYAKHDGAWFAYLGAVPTGSFKGSQDQYLTQGYADLYRVGLDGGAHRVAEGSDKDRRWLVDDQGEVIAYSDYDRKTGAWKVLRPGSSKPVAEGKSDFGFEIVGRGRTPSTAVISGNSSEHRYMELNVDDGSQVPLANEVIDQLIEARDTRLLVGVGIAGEIRKVLMYDPNLARHMEAIARAFAGDSVTVKSISTDRSKIVVYVEGKTTGGTWQLVDFNTGKSTPLADRYPDIPDDMLGQPQVVEYRAGDGLAIKGILTLPPGRQPQNLPLVVLPHGGPELMDYVRFDWWAQAFASRGYAVFQPNFRGSSGHGTAFRDAGFGQWGRKMQTDVSDGVAYLAQQGLIDPKRACIVGGSYGGYAALAGVTLQHGLYRCAAAYGGVSNPTGMMRNIVATEGDHYARAELRYWKTYFGIGEDASSVPDDISPLAHAADADAPILLIHGKDDTVVSFQQSSDMESALRRAGKQVEFLQLKGEDHWLSRSETRLQMLTAMVDFVEKYNPAEAPATH